MYKIYPIGERVYKMLTGMCLKTDSELSLLINFVLRETHQYGQSKQ